MVVRDTVLRTEHWAYMNCMSIYVYKRKSGYFFVFFARKVLAFGTFVPRLRQKPRVKRNQRSRRDRHTPRGTWYFFWLSRTLLRPRRKHTRSSRRPGERHGIREIREIRGRLNGAHALPEVLRCQLWQPVSLDLSHVPHVEARGEEELVEDDAAGAPREEN